VPQTKSSLSGYVRRNFKGGMLSRTREDSSDLRMRNIYDSERTKVCSEMTENEKLAAEALK
jgi:hypothetical protein